MILSTLVRVIFIYLALLSLAVALWGVFSCGTWDLVPQLGITPGFSALGMWSLSHWPTKKVPWKISLLSLQIQVLTHLKYLYRYSQK